MKILNVVPKDLHVTFEISLIKLKMLSLFLERSKVEYNSETEPEMAEAVKYIAEGLYPNLADFLDEMEKK